MEQYFTKINYEYFYFKKFENELKEYTQSYLIYVNNSEKILKIFSEKLKNQIEEKVKNFPFIISLMEILSGLVKDLRDETYDEFLDNIFPNLIKLLSETQNVEAIEKTFGVLVNIFKFLQNAILKPRNFSKFFYIFSEMIFNRTKYIRKFACESISYLIKNLDEDKLGDIMLIFLNPFLNPEKYFNLDNSENYANKIYKREKSNNINFCSFNENFLEKIYSYDNVLNVNINRKNKEQINLNINNNSNYFISFLHVALLNFEFDLFNFQVNKKVFNVDFINDYNQKLKLKVFLIECLSDFIYEIIIGVNKDLSIKADLFLEKIKIKIPNEEKENNNNITNNNKSNNNIKKENSEYLNFIIDLSVITCLIKLYNRMKNDKKNSVISLLNFYLLKKLDKEIKFNKLKNEKISNQLEFYTRLNYLQKNSMEIDEQSNSTQIKKLNKLRFVKANCFVLMNFFITEIFIKCQFKFDKEIKRFLFEFFRLSTKKISSTSQINICNYYNIFYEVKCEKPELNCKNYFTRNIKINLLGLLIKFYPEEFSEIFKFEYIALNPYSKIHQSFNIMERDNLDILNLLKIFFNCRDTEKNEDYIDYNNSINLIDENILSLFLVKLKNLQKFKYFKSLSFFENRSIIIKNQFNNKDNELKENDEEEQENLGERNNTLTKQSNLQIENVESHNPYLDNDDYNIDYNADLINKLFSFILNVHDFSSIENILNIKTTYDLILIKNSKTDVNINSYNDYNFIDESNINFESADNITNNYTHTNLLIANDNNLKIIVEYLKDFSIDSFKNTIESDNEDSITLEKYVEIYSFLIIGDILIKSVSSLKNLKNKNFEVKDKNQLYLSILKDKNEIYFDFIKKSIETILVVFDNKSIIEKENFSELHKKNFACDVLKLSKEEDIMLYNILFRDFNDVRTFYIDKSTAFINLLNLFTVNYLKIILMNKSNTENEIYNKSENDLFISRILFILFKNCDNGISFKTINIIIKFYFNSNFDSFEQFCFDNKIFFIKKQRIYEPITQIFEIDKRVNINTNKNILFVNSLEEFLYTYSTIFYSSDNKIKSEFLFFVQLWLKSLNNFNLKSLEEIFDLMNYILNIEFDTLNDKKYSLNYEILVSKIEMITLDSEDFRGIFLFGFFYDFLLGSYWIRLTKTLWPVLTKCIERFFQALGKLINEKLFWLIFSKTIKLFEFIYNVGTIDNLLENIDRKKFDKFYFIFSEKFEVTESNSNLSSACYLENIIITSFYAKRDNVASLALNVNLFYEGFLKSQHYFDVVINGSNSILLEKNLSAGSKFYLFDNFYKFFSRIINPKNENWLNEVYRTNETFNSNLKALNKEKNMEITNQTDSIENFNKFYMNYFNNFITQKESSKFFSNTNKNLQEAILTIISKISFSSVYKIKENDLFTKKENVKLLLYDQLIFSRTVIIQKLCVTIYLNLEPKLKKFYQLFEKLIENPNLIDRLYNLQDIRTDSNEQISYEEKQLLIPILIRLYYSKYFYLSNKTKKVKTRNKINIVSFFIQLTPEEFKEYIKVIFRPLMIFEDFENNEIENNQLMIIDSNDQLNGLNSLNSKNLLKEKFENEILFCENALLADEFINENINDINKANDKITRNFQSIKFLDMRIYRKIIEILSLNFKQINSLFETSIDFLTILIMNILIFIKKSNNFYKVLFDYKKYQQNKYLSGKHNHEEEEILFDNEAENLGKMDSEKNYQEELDSFLFNFEKEIKKDKTISQSKFISYWEKDKVFEYSNLYFKFVKEIKKKSFELLRKIFIKFSFKTDLIKIVTDRLFHEYEDIYNYLPKTDNLKVNSLLQFTFDIAKNPIMHKIYIDNSTIFISICKILTNNKIDNKFLNSLLEFLENIIIPYSEYKIELEEQQMKELDDEYNQLQNFKKIDKSHKRNELGTYDENSKEKI